MAAVVEGIYQNGKIELLQPPTNVPEGRVCVILIPQQDRPKPPPRLMAFGMFPGDSSTLEDFKDAEWHGEKEWGPSDGE